jgi:hypothetical protein
MSIQSQPLSDAKTLACELRLSNLQSFSNITSILQERGSNEQFHWYKDERSPPSAVKAPECYRISKAQMPGHAQ